MKIAIGTDHRGFELKEALIAHMRDNGHEVVDCGVDGVEAFDYPVIVKRVCDLLVAGEVDRAILICYTGIGSSICANKFPGVRASLCHDRQGAELTRQHNDSNVLVFGSLYVDSALGTAMTDIWLATAFEGGRHQRRIDLITEIEKH